jgi:uncharacterized protein
VPEAGLPTRDSRTPVASLGAMHADEGQPADVPASEHSAAPPGLLESAKDPLYVRPPRDLGSARVWFFLAFGGFIGGYIASEILLTVFAATSGNLKNLTQLESLAVPPWWVTIAGLVGLWIGFVGAAILASRLRGTGNLFSDMGLRFTWWDAPFGILVGVVGQVLIDLLYVPFEHVDKGLSHELSEPGNRLTGGFHGADLVVIAVLTVVVVPVVEELFFRGLLLQSLVRLFRGAGRIAGPALAMLSTGVLFGLAHAELVELAGLALFGVILCVMAYRTGRLGACIFAHAAFNGFAVISISTQGRIL